MPIKNGSAFGFEENTVVAVVVIVMIVTIRVPVQNLPPSAVARLLIILITLITLMIPISVVSDASNRLNKPCFY